MPPAAPLLAWRRLLGECHLRRQRRVHDRRGEQLHSLLYFAYHRLGRLRRPPTEHGREVTRGVPRSGRGGTACAPWGRPGPPAPPPPPGAPPPPPGPRRCSASLHAPPRAPRRSPSP